MRSSLGVALLILAVVEMLLPRTASAYIDPGTGSLIFQIIVGAILGAVLTVKLWWLKVKYFFAHLFSGKKRPDDDGGEA